MMNCLRSRQQLLSAVKKKSTELLNNCFFYRVIANNLPVIIGSMYPIKNTLSIQTKQNKCRSTLHQKSLSPMLLQKVIIG